MSGGSWTEEGYLYRASITVDNSANATTRDAVVAIPVDWDAFWDTLADVTNGYDAVIIDPTTGIKVSYQQSSWVYASRTLVLQMDNVTDASLVTHLWLYWGKSAAANRATIFGYAAGATAYVELGTPGPSDLVVKARRHKDQTSFDETLTKPTTEEAFVWLDLEKLLQSRPDPYNGDTGYEAAIDFDFRVELNGAAQAAMSDDTLLRIVEGRYVRGLVKAGTDATDYTGVFTVTTSLNRTVDYRFLIQVRDQQE
jgi:hypothetical protein